MTLSKIRLNHTLSSKYFLAPAGVTATARVTQGLILLAGSMMLNVPAAQAEIPEGQSLRSLAEIAGIQIGYASRDQFEVPEDAANYDAIVRREFNIATPENSLKWNNLHPQPDVYEFEFMDILADFAETNNMELHGHPLLWHRLNPDWLDEVVPGELEAVMNAHIDTVVGRYAGRIQVWDVVNEGLEDPELGGGYRQTQWFEAMGPDYIKKSFVRARAADASAELIYNDYDVGWLNEKSDAMLELVKGLQTDEVPITGVGFQMHVNTEFSDYEGFSLNMQRFADLDLDIYISELDVQAQSVDEYPLQAEIYEKILERCLWQPRCKTLQIWGINDYYSWLPWFDPLLFDDDYNVKPAYYGLQRALSTHVVHPEDAVCTAGVTTENGLVSVLASRPLDATGTTPTRWLEFDQIDLSAGFTELKVRYKNSGAATARVSVRTGTLDGTAIVDALLPVTGADFSTLTVPVMAEHTLADLLVVFSEGSDAVVLDTLMFAKPESALAPRAEADEAEVGCQNPSDNNGGEVQIPQTNDSSGALGFPTLVLLMGGAIGVFRRRR